MSRTIPPISPPLGASTGSPSSPDVNRVDTMPTTETINTTTTTNVGPSDTRDTKIVAIRLKFNAFTALEGEKVNDTYTRLKFLLNDLENNGVFISQAESQCHVSSSKALVSNINFQDSDADVEEDNITNNEFMADLNVEYQERALLANQKRFYKRSGRVGSARKPIDKSKEACFTYGKLVTKGKGDKGKSEKGLITESFGWDDESVSLEDEDTTNFKAFMAIAEDDPSDVEKGGYAVLNAVNTIIRKFLGVRTKQGIRRESYIADTPVI
ncbi:hypothetical protein Tco_0400306 [Tanacetum coccineum]